VSKTWIKQRARLFAAPQSADAPSKPPTRSADRNTDTVERDFAPLRTRGRGTSRPWLVIAVGTLAAALMIVSLRVSILRLRYQLSAAVTEETELLERQRTVTVELRKLRDPTRLQELASELGFVRPEQVIQLSVPATGADEPAP
jgi:hypothetical protein